MRKLIQRIFSYSSYRLKYFLIICLRICCNEAMNHKLNTCQDMRIVCEVFSNINLSIILFKDKLFQRDISICYFLLDSLSVCISYLIFESTEDKISAICCWIAVDGSGIKKSFRVDHAVLG